MAERQDGVLGRGQARRGGLSEDAWQWRLDRGTWQAVLPGVAVCHSGEPTAQQRAWASVVYAGRGAALSGDAALRAHGMALPEPDVLQVAVPPERIVVAQSHPGIAVRAHRVNGVAELIHPVKVLPVLRAQQAVLHAAAWAISDRAAEWRVVAAVQQRVVTPADVRTALVRSPRLRRRAMVARLLDDVELGAHALSELDLLRLLRRSGLPRPDELQLKVRAGRRVRYLDAAWRRQRVVAEVDGAHHQQAATWDADVLRANELQVSSRDDRLLLLRFTTGHLRHEPDSVVRQLRAVLL